MRPTTKSLPQAQLDRLVGLFNAGRHQELEAHSRNLIQRYPDSGFVWKTLSLALYAQGKEALPALRKAAELLPDDADAHSNLGAVEKYLGHCDSAVISFLHALKLRPMDSGLLFYLGATYFDLGRFEKAMSNFELVLAIQPGHVEACLLHANSLLQIGQAENAIKSYRRVLDISPEHAEALSNLGKALADMGQWKDAVNYCLRALETRSEFAEAHINLGNAYKGLGQSRDALASYRRALEINPDSVLAHNNLGLSLVDLGLKDEAIDCFRHALSLKPDYLEARCNLGNALADCEHLDDAVVSYRQALSFNPGFFEAWVNLGHALEMQGKFHQAVSSYQEALALAPDNAQACSNLGNALVSLKRFDEAVASCRRALEINPDFFEAHCNLGNALLNLGQFDKALSCFVRAQEIKVDSARAQSSLLFLRNYLASQTASILVAEARRFGELAALDARTHTDWYSHSDPERRLRIGFVSGDLGNHPVGYFFESMLARLAIGPADWLELIAYPSFIREDEVATRIRSHCHGWHSAVGSSDEKLAQRIRDDGIDILIDLSGHTAHNRLSMFAWKPAPIQVSWLGYFATTGLAEMDYLLADPWTVPVGEEFHFTETIWRMPETYLCFSPPELDLRVGPLPALASRVITFSCFNNLAKMNDAVVALWARVLQAVPESCLFLKTGQLEAANMRQSVAQRFAEHGIDAARLVLEGPSPRAELLAAYNRVDIALDPFPYPGGTTSAEALWMGVPVLTLEGDRFLSHIGESILQNAGLPDWIAADADDYVARAVAHARDIPRLAELRHGLRQQVLASPLFDAPRFARHFETALRGMWAHWCQQQQENQS